MRFNLSLSNLNEILFINELLEKTNGDIAIVTQVRFQDLVKFQFQIWMFFTDKGMRLKH